MLVLRISRWSEAYAMSLADLGEITVYLIGSFAIGLAFGVKIQSVIHFFKQSS